MSTYHGQGTTKQFYYVWSHVIAPSPCEVNGITGPILQMQIMRCREVKYLAEGLVVNRCWNLKASLCDQGACAPNCRNPSTVTPEEAVLTFSLMGLRETSFFKHRLGTPRFAPFFLCTRPDPTWHGWLVLCDGTTNTTLSGTALNTVGIQHWARQIESLSSRNVCSSLGDWQ